MWIHGAAVAGVVIAACAAWAWFQLWLEKNDSGCKLGAGCCGGSGKDCKFSRL